MDVHVDQAGQQGQARQVETAGVGGQVRRDGGPDRGDASVDDHDDGIVDIAAALDIDHAGGGDHQGVGAGGRREAQRESEGGGGQTVQHGVLPRVGEACMEQSPGQPESLRQFRTHPLACPLPRRARLL
ncbi:hypothetical protein ASD25_27205 [Brevundimonas sp. Root1423]|nr:hypothetical protein ASD25_27205 [Brevundimonas sp. Root1423]